MISARKLKQRKTTFDDRHFGGAIAVGVSGDVTLHLPMRRKPTGGSSAVALSNGDR